MVEVIDVCKFFGDKQALSNLSFSAREGQVCGLLGPNGAGKTTLFRLLMGILKASSGRVVVDGLDAFEDRVAAKRRIGFLPDEPVFYSYLTARETLELSLRMHGEDLDAAMRRLTPIIEQMKLDNELDRYAEEYSRGMKKKLGLLLALAHKPRLLVLDEPTNGLDVEATRLFYEIIQEQSAQGVTVIFSSHLLDQVARLCESAVIIRNGSLVASGSIQELLQEHGQTDLEELFLQLTGGSQR